MRSEETIGKHRLMDDCAYLWYVSDNYALSFMVPLGISVPVRSGQ